jgi:methylmalonyl-CoA/ethylmalonyl-CoA epimerase
VEIVYPGDAPGPIDEKWRGTQAELSITPVSNAGDLRASLAAIEAANLRPVCVLPPRPAVRVGDRSMSFNVVRIGLIEILE